MLRVFFAADLVCNIIYRAKQAWPSCDGCPVPHLQEEGNQPQCCLCPVEGGALKPTTIPGLWCHAACMQWIPEVAVEDVSKMEPVTHIKSIQRERWELLCTICRWGWDQACLPVPAASSRR